jgi:hypothetical protein
VPEFLAAKIASVHVICTRFSRTISNGLRVKRWNGRHTFPDLGVVRAKWRRSPPRCSVPTPTVARSSHFAPVPPLSRPPPCLGSLLASPSLPAGSQTPRFGHLPPPRPRRRELPRRRKMPPWPRPWLLTKERRRSGWCFQLTSPPSAFCASATRCAAPLERYID